MTKREKAARRAELSLEIIPLQARVEQLQYIIKYQHVPYLVEDLEELEKRVEELRNEYFELI